jgi:hypothetical protein
MTSLKTNGWRSVRRWASATALATTMVACGDVSSILEVTDPDLINPSDTKTASAAVALANGAVSTFNSTTGGGESTWLFGGLLADEWSTSSTFIQNDETDQRQIQLINSSITGMLRQLYRTRTRASEAIVALNTYAPTRRTLIAEMFLAKGFAELQLASDFCNGIPISDGLASPPVPGAPKTTAEVFALAAASLDAGLTYANGTDATSVMINRALRVARGRVHLALGEFAQAGTVVASVPTSFKYQHTYSLTTSSNTIWGQGLSSRRYSMGDSLEGNTRTILVANAIPFASSRDPRLGTVVIPTSGSINGQDGQTYTRTTTLWGQLSAVDVANGIDARLIEAEAALQANQPATWLAIHNALRGTAQTLSDAVTTPVLSALTDPGTTAGRVDRHFREKAFWTFSRGQRLGDMRRLIRQYGRSEATVFPQGTHYKGGSYGKDVNLPVTQPEENNPLFTGCLDRNP